MAQTCQCRVSLEEIGEAAGYLTVGAVLAHAERLGIATADDWAGRLSVATADAGALYAAITGAAEENNRANAERLRAEDEATRAREAAENAVYQEAFNQEVRRGMGEIEAAQRAAKAVAEFREEEYPGFFARIRQAVSR